VGHLVFSISDVTAEGPVVPGPFRSDGGVRVWRTADLAGDAQAADILADLTALLEERPDLASYMTVVPASEHDPLPYLPVPQAAQVLRARATYVDTPEVSGVAYVAGFRQDIGRFGRDEFFYEFHGVSADGASYIAVEWSLTAPGFPRRPRFVEGDTQGSRWADYLNESIATLNATDPAAFAPPLAALDALVASIAFEEAPTAQGSPAPSASLSPAT
jgi:hypothetical protein